MSAPMISIPEALTRYANGEFLIVVDDLDRENEGDLILLASQATPEKVAFMVTHTTGILCVALTKSRARELNLPLMVENNEDERRTAFTVAVDFAPGITTGVSAIERARTIRALAEPTTQPKDLIRPGHVYPLVAHDQVILQNKRCSQRLWLPMDRWHEVQHFRHLPANTKFQSSRLQI